MDRMTDRLAAVAAAMGEDVRSAVIAARQARFAGVQFDVSGLGVVLAELSMTGRREFSHVLSAQGLKLVGFRAALGPKGFGPGADVDRILNQLTRVMEAAKG